MNRMMRVAMVAGLVLAGAAIPAAAQDSLASARQLYGSAAYDEALSMLERLKKSAPPLANEALTVEQYRAFCLMALGRQSDAVQAMESVVVADPFFRPTEEELSPRVLASFRDARRRLLPGIAQQRYQAAKNAYDRKDYASALAGFETTIRILESPDLAEAAAQPPLSDLRTLLNGFVELARTAAAPPPPKPEAKPAPAPPPPPPKAFYTAEDAGVVAPVALNQRLPRWPTNAQTLMPRGRVAILEVLITEQGTVERAAVRPSLSPLYDELVVNEARGWRYRPATKDNVPVKFKKAIQLTVQ